MKEDLYEAQYLVTKKNKLKEFYEKNKILIFSIIFILIIFIGSIIFYSGAKVSSMPSISGILRSVNMASK